MNNKEKNTYVKKQITKALIALLKEKSIHEITINELTSKAEIGRVSFYRNFNSKEEILQKESERLLMEWGNLFENKGSDDAYNNFFLSLFDFFRANKDFYTTIYQCGMSYIIMDTLVSSADILPEMTNLDAYLKSFWAYGIYGWIIEWIKRGMSESSKELLELFKQAEVKNL